MSPLRPLVVGGLGALLAALAGLVAGGVFAGSGWVLPVVGGTAVPAALVLGVGRFRGSVLAGLAGLGGLALVLALGIAPGGTLVSGGQRLLTGALPLEARPAEVAAVTLGAGAAAVAAAVVALVTRRAARVALPGLLALAAALWVSASAGAPATVLVAAVALVAGCLLALDGSEPAAAPAGADGPAGPAGPAPWRRPAAAALLLAVGAGVATSGAQLPGATAREARADARDLVEVPVQPRSSTSPLARFAGLAGGEPRPFATLTGDPVGRLRLATLDTFDGERWTSQATGIRAGRVLPEPPADGLPRTTTRITVELADPAGVDFLPTPGRAVEVSEEGLGVVPGTGDLLVPAGRTAPAGYDVTGTTADLRAVALPAARAAQVEPLDVPPSLREEATERAVGATSFARLAALERSLADEGTRAEGEDLPGGSGLFQVERLLEERRGTDEQYASAFAVLAGALGHDTRVVVGLRPQPPSGGQQSVSTTDVVAWPEVRFERLGWLPFAPTPAGAADEPPPPGAPEEVVRRAVEEAQRAAPPAPPPVTGPGPAAPRPVPDDRSAWAVAAVLAAGLLGLGLLALLLVPPVKAVRRRRRRRATDPRARVLGAWGDTVERLRESGVAVTPASTPSDILTASRPLLPAGGAPGDVEQLAGLAGLAAWSASPVGDSHAERAWSCADAVRAGLRGGRPVRRRVLDAFDPRPLVAGRRRRRVRPPARRTGRGRPAASRGAPGRPGSAPASTPGGRARTWRG